MTCELSFDNQSGAIFLICLFYAVHMVEEFSFGFVQWADRYFGRFDWTQNLVGNFIFLVCVSAACYLYYVDPTRYLWAGMSAAMWILANAFLHISCTILGREYSPGVVTATALYVPGGVYFLSQWGRDGLLTWQNVTLSFLIGGMLFMLIPTFARAVHFRARIAKIFHLVK
ncbi:MAG: HXXEE domain-containing protein [Desulfomonilaceae bacterium]|nr:HXXEE domain-containing protein [Desulfomonilaceae bacterium]